MFSAVSVRLFVCLSTRLLKKLWTDFDEIFEGMGRGSKTTWSDFDGNPDHNPPDPAGVF